jgi:hypothetical protein
MRCTRWRRALSSLLRRDTVAESLVKLRLVAL